MKIVVNSQREAVNLSGQLTRLVRCALESGIDYIVSSGIETVLCNLRDSIVVEEADQRMIGITQGIALACGQVCEMGQPQIAKDILRGAGMLSKRELLKNDVDFFDITKLAEILES